MDFLKTGYLSDEEMEAVRHQRDAGEYSTFGFLSSHNGIRKGEVCAVISPLGNGKSTFCRTIIHECLIRKKQVLLYISEESVEQYLYDVNNLIRKTSDSSTEAQECLERLMVMSELDVKPDNSGTILKLLSELTTIFAPDVLFIDNLTTSVIGQENVAAQGRVSYALKDLAVKNNIPVFTVIHTRKGASLDSSQLFNSENVRGNATSVNVGSYNYVVATFFQCKPHPRTFVLVDKARYHGKANKKYFELFFNDDTKIYDRDTPVDYQEITQIWTRAKQTEKSTLKEAQRVGVEKLVREELERQKKGQTSIW